MILKVSCHSLLAGRKSAEKSVASLVGIPLCVTCCFPLAAFSILSLSLIFVIFITSCLGVFLFVFILYGTLCTSWSWMLVSFPRLRKFLAVIYSNIFSGLLSLSSSGTPIMQILVHLMLSQRSLKLSFLFIPFFFFFSVQL